MLKRGKATKYTDLIAYPKSEFRWRRRQDSNLWYPFEVQRFSKPPLSATQPRLQPARNASFNSSGRANFVKVQGILHRMHGCNLTLDTSCIWQQNNKVVGTSHFWSVY